MDTPFLQWQSATRFNKLVSNSIHHYVVLISKTHSFQIDQDLKHCLGITKKPTVWFVEKFKKYCVQVEYGTLFNQDNIKIFGPLAVSTSNAIVRCYLQSKYSSSVVLVCPARLAKQMPFQTISPEAFVDRITG